MGKVIYFEAYSVGLCAASVCTNLPADEVAAEMNRQHPTGIASKWELSKDPTFRTGQPNPNPCEDRRDCKHYLLCC